MQVATYQENACNVNSSSQTLCECHVQVGAPESCGKWQLPAPKMLQMENGQKNKSKQEKIEKPKRDSNNPQTIPAPLQSGGTWCNVPNKRDVICKCCKRIFSLLSRIQHGSWCQGDPWFNDLQYRILR